jgi:hypothetical protein
MELTVFVGVVFGWAAGRHAIEQLALLATVVAPVPSAVVMLVLAVHQVRRSRPVDRRSAGVLLLVRLAAQLRSGSTLRMAIGEVASGDPDLESAARLAEAGRPISHVVDAMAPGLGRFARLTGASIRMAATSGGALAPVVEQLVVQAMALDDLARERRSAMAPGLLQAVVVGGVPVVVLASMLGSGRFIDLLASGPFHAAAALVGAGLTVSGVAVVARIVWKDVR